MNDFFRYGFWVLFVTVAVMLYSFNEHLKNDVKFMKQISEQIAIQKVQLEAFRQRLEPDTSIYFYDERDSLWKETK